jgi:channel protein (hemolysin III family)
VVNLLYVTQPCRCILLSCKTHCSSYCVATCHQSLCAALPPSASRLDHSAIYSLIAATYTPFVMLPVARVAGDVDSRQLLCRIWLGALCGVGKVSRDAAAAANVVVFLHAVL